MERSWYWRLALVIGLIVGGLYVAAPSFIYLTSSPDVRRSKKLLAEKMPEGLPSSRMNLGIDLQGGLHMVMGVDVNKAVLNRADRVADELAVAMQEAGKPLASARRGNDESPVVELELKNAADWETLKPLVEDRGDTWTYSGPSGTSVRMEMIAERAKQLKDDAVAQSIKTLRNRIDPKGVTEPEVRKRGDDAVLIQIAGITAEEERRVKDDIIGKTAQLEFKIVDDESKYFAEISARAPAEIKLSNDAYQGANNDVVSSPYLYSPSREALENFLAANPPPGDRVISYSKIPVDGVEQWRTWLLDRKTPLTGDSIVNALAAFNRDENQYYVALTLDRAGGNIFDQLTAANIKKRVAIVLDDMVDSAPVIQTRIPSGNVSITLGGYKSAQEILKDAQSLATVLNAGALPAPVYPQEERTVGATLGDDAVGKGGNAVIAAAILTIIVMIGYYKVSGVIAIFAMSVNLLLLFASMSALGGTLTLPGLAGFALTIGMAVDANIVQFERIREELRAGKTVRAAVDAGFDKAFSAIFDSNVTTILAALVLMQYGSGPIRGFAVTLFAGTIINLLTAILVPRVCLDYLARNNTSQTLSI